MRVFSFILLCCFAAHPANATILLNSPGLFVTWKQGDIAPASTNVIIQSSGTSFSSTISTNPSGWLTISPKAGSGNTVAIVSIAPQGLSIGDYLGLISFAETGSNLGNTTTYQVHLTVQAGQPSGMTSPSTSFGWIPHIADGNGWTTSIRVVNLSNYPQRVSVDFWSDSGTSLSLPIIGLGASRGVYWDLDAYGSGLCDTNGGAILTAGYATFSASVGDASSFTASAIFRTRAVGLQDSEAISPMILPSNHSLVLPFDNRNGFSTGIAVVNSGTGVAIPVIARDAYGAVLINQNVTISPGGHAAFSLADKFPNLTGAIGMIEFSGPSMPLGLRFNPAGSFTSIIPAQKP